MRHSQDLARRFLVMHNNLPQEVCELIFPKNNTTNYTPFRLWDSPGCYTHLAAPVRTAISGKACVIFSNTSFLMKVHAHFQINFFPTFVFHRQVTSFKTAFNRSFSVILSIQQVPMINEIFSYLIDYFTNMRVFESKDPKVLAHSSCSIKVESHM